MLGVVCFFAQVKQASRCAQRLLRFAEKNLVSRRLPDGARRSALRYRSSETAQLNDAGSRAPGALAVERRSPRLSAILFEGAGPAFAAPAIEVDQRSDIARKCHAARFVIHASDNQTHLEHMRIRATDAASHIDTSLARSSRIGSASLGGPPVCLFQIMLIATLSLQPKIATV
jgi:hypothetical protein